MKLQIKAALITAGIVAAACMFGTVVAFFPEYIAGIAMVFIVGVFIRHIYQDILYKLQKSVEQRSVDPKRDSV